MARFALVFLAVCPLVPAQSDPAKALAAILDTPVRTNDDVQTKRSRLRRLLDDTERFDPPFLRTLAHCHATAREASVEHARELLAELSAGAPETTGFETHIGSALLTLGIDATNAGRWAEAEAALPLTMSYHADPKSVIWLLGRRGRDHGSADGKEFMHDVVVPALLTDVRTSDEHRVHVLRKLYDVTYHGPKPLDDLAGTDLDGNAIRRSDFVGKVLLVDFWATWCVPCMMAMPGVVEAHRRFKDRGFAVLGVSLDRPNAEAEIRETAKRVGMDWPQLYDGGFWQTKWAVDNQVLAVPATYLIDRTGKVRYTNLEGAELTRRIEELLRQ